ncbi:hypothetical protein CYMTET_12507 [Cymbomonas tetramitiformis]|uniref:Uncharacterized protein n=1 Tax=Cymbomonas tetramitiformis TaxID=36881 RepID=A0AAE0GKE4_9CHLO|nr:hypothetical protein CYMTET_12507 [Cymbomonas tetramitiformis]
MKFRLGTEVRKMEIPWSSGNSSVAARPWIHDIDIVTTNSLTTTGGHVWDAAQRLVEFLENMQLGLGLLRPGVKVLELGAGCGLSGLTVARNLPLADRVVLTEQAYGGALDHLVMNVELNRDKLPSSCAVTAQPCDWTHYQPTSPTEGDLNSATESEDGVSGGEQEGNQGELADCLRLETLPETISWDFIIGSDLVYNEAGTKMLPRVMRAHVDTHTRIIYAHTRHRFDSLDCVFLEELAAVGLECREVREHDVPTPPPSPPPFTDLFPEMRIAVYEIMLPR